MKLLFDENLSYKLSERLQDAFPGSRHVRELGLERASDFDIWRFARSEGYVIVTNDADFNDILLVNGFPPFVVWLRTGNRRVAQVEAVIEDYRNEIIRVVSEGHVGMLEIFDRFGRAT